MATLALPGNSAFRLINPATDTGPVERSDPVKGYEFEMDRYTIVTAEELNAVRLETTDNLEIEQFVATVDGGKGGRRRAV